MAVVAVRLNPFTCAYFEFFLPSLKLNKSVEIAKIIIMSKNMKTLTE